jgi:transketolase
MDLPVGFIFTHDSLMVGEDGPTHQPVEQVSALRLIPNLHVWRPADGGEVAAAWHATLTRTDGPTAMCLTRQGVPNLDRPANFMNADMMTGGYVIHDPDDAVATVIATGSEVATVIDAAIQLAAKGKPMRVISMPCVERFRGQPADYRRRILGALPVLAVEMGVSDLWCQFTGDIDRVIGIDSFGASGPGKVLADHFGFTSDHLARRLGEMI